MHRTHVRSLLVAGSFLLSGCATLVNPGNVRTDPARGGRVMDLGVWRVPEGARLYVNGEPVLLPPERPNELRLEAGKRDFTLAVPQDAPFTLTVESGGERATVRLESKTYWRWIWFNGLLGPAFPVGVIVDASTKKWTYLQRNLVDATQMLEVARRQRGGR